MKASAQQSRNQRRKALYASMANKESRNQEMLTAPVVGRVVDIGEGVKVTADPLPTKREPNAQKRRRQLAAWKRCAWLAVGAHRFEGDNCRSCGCPKSEAA